MSEESIMRALAQGMDPEVVADREALRYAVMRTIFCPYTQEVLDIRRAVLVTVTVSTGQTTSYVMTAANWDKVRESCTSWFNEEGYSWSVVDGHNVSW